MARSIVLIYTLSLSVLLCHGGYNGFFNLKLLFPTGSSMGLFLALAIPLDLPNKNVFLAYNFEANYNLPTNVTSTEEGEFPPVVERTDREGKIIGNDTTGGKAFGGINRKFVYDLLESKITSHGYPGRMCLLRAICETALYPVNETNGVFGDIIHIVFTPSSSKQSGVTEDYEDAEKYGRNRKSCAFYQRNCTVSLLSLVSWVGNTG